MVKKSLIMYFEKYQKIKPKNLYKFTYIKKQLNQNIASMAFVQYNNKNQALTPKWHSSNLLSFNQILHITKKE